MVLRMETLPAWSDLAGRQASTGNTGNTVTSALLLLGELLTSPSTLPSRWCHPESSHHPGDCLYLIWSVIRVQAKYASMLCQPSLSVSPLCKQK